MSLSIQSEFKQWLDEKYLDSITVTYLKMMDGANDFAYSNGLTDLDIYDFIIPESFRVLSTEILSLLSHTPITNENFLKMKAALDEFNAFISEEGRFSQDALDEAKKAIEKDIEERDAREKRLEEERARKRAEEEAKKKEMLSLFSSVTVAEEDDEGEIKEGEETVDSFTLTNENVDKVPPHHVFRVLKHSKEEEQSESSLKDKEIPKTLDEVQKNNSEDVVEIPKDQEENEETLDPELEENVSSSLGQETSSDTSTQIIQEELSENTASDKELIETEKTGPEEETEFKLEESDNALSADLLNEVTSESAEIQEETEPEFEPLSDPVTKLNEEAQPIQIETSHIEEAELETAEEVPTSEAAHIKPHLETEDETGAIISTNGEALFTKAELFDAFFNEDEDELDFFNSLASLEIEEDEKENEPAFESFVAGLGSFSDQEEKPPIDVEDEEVKETIQAADEIEEDNILVENAKNESAYETFVKEDETEADNLGTEEELQDFFASLNLTNPYESDEVEEIEIPIELESLPADDDSLEVEDFFKKLKDESSETNEEFSADENSASLKEDYDLFDTFTSSIKIPDTVGYVPFHKDGEDHFEPISRVAEKVEVIDTEETDQAIKSASEKSEAPKVSSTLGYVPYKADRIKEGFHENDSESSSIEFKEENSKTQALLEDSSRDEKLISGTEPLCLEGSGEQEVPIELGGPIELEGSISSMKLEDSLKNQRKLEDTKNPLQIEGSIEEDVIELNGPIGMDGSVSSMKLVDSHKDQKKLEKTEEPLSLTGEKQEKCPIELGGPIEMGGTIEMEGPTAESKHSLVNNLTNLGAGIASVFSPENATEKTEEEVDIKIPGLTSGPIQVEEGVTETGEDSLEVELPPDHVKPVTEAVKAVSEKTQGTLNDYAHPTLLTPVSFSIGKKAAVQVKDWEELYVRLIDELTYLDRKSMAALLSYSTGSRIRKPRMTATGYVIETDLKPEVMVRNLDAMLSLCMIDPSDIRLSFLNE